MRKLQQFYIMKFPLDRLAKFNYSINRTISQARKNKELIALGDSQVLRLIREIRYEKDETCIKYSQEALSVLFEEKKKIQKLNSSKDNIQKLQDIDNTIDEMLFIPEYVSIVTEDDNQFRYINENEDVLKINGKPYVRLLCSAGQARVNTTIFVLKDIEQILKLKLRCGANDIEITDNKWNAYFALSSSSTHIVSKPNVLFIDDCEIKMKKVVDWVSHVNKNDDDFLVNNEKVESIEKELEFNLFDGCGAISVEKAKEWANELELDYIPSAFCIRCAFIKGMVFVVDFKDFAKNVAKIEGRYDKYGVYKTIEDVDIILTKSQFKLSDAYDSIEDYDKKCIENNINWGVSKVTPKQDGDSFRSNYQFCQVLNLDNNDIELLCTPNIDWLTGVTTKNINYTLLYLLGDICNKKDLDYNNILKLTNDNIAKALILNNKLIEDEYIRNTIFYSINKKIKETYIGKLLLDGNFSIMIPDMLAFMEHTFSMKIEGALKENEHYSNYWNSKNVKDVVAMRSPLTWRSEVNKLNLVKNDKTEKWFKYLTSGIIYNVFGCDCIIHADSDWDGDLVSTTDNSVFVSKRYDNLPITYEKKTVPKKKIKENDLYKADLQSYHSKIGSITNKSTSMYDVIAKFERNKSENNMEYEEMLQRLRLMRKAQGDSIDKAKGIKVEKMPSHWTVRQQIITDEKAKDIYKKRQRVANNPDNIKPIIPDNDEVIARKEFMNSIVADKKPYFFRYLYPTSYSKYKKYIDEKNKYCTTVFGISLDELIHKDSSTLTEDEIKFIDNYHKYIPLCDYGGVMNNICHYMEDNLKELAIDRNYRTPNYVIDIFKTDLKIDKDKLVELEKLYHHYKKAIKKIKAKNKSGVDSSIKVNIDDEEEFNSIDQYCKYLRKKALVITSNKNELVNLAVELCYVQHQQWSKDFVWNVFGNYLIDNIKLNKQKNIYLPVLSESGDITYLGRSYERKEINV